MAPPPSIPSDKDLETALRSYDSSLEERSTASSSRKRSPHLPSSKVTLVDLDTHVWSDLPKALATRSRQQSNGGASITHTELIECVAWKLLRGKYRPTLPALVASNSEEKVKEVTARAWDCFVPASRARTDGDDDGNLRNFACVRVLTELKGIGPATASLLLAVFELAAAEAESAASSSSLAAQEGFMSDESWACLPALAGRKIAYGEADWKRWRKAWGERLREWKGDVLHGVKDLDRATWSWCTGGGSSAGQAAAPQKDEKAATAQKRSRSAAQDEGESKAAATTRRTSKRAR